ncbi:chorismate--pyruvate lyase family protein [Thiomicrorhabdus aquaedulcis]|uniref:chorismate--pyruvate lyase family protein n=1 Tax=Thiomicrorhabdus aquaedulcis TaxID=2211106 RepID=UPI000FD9BF4E|nr:chorismate lyase [Thiomicrorhabdus aquaedulcis]
MLNDTTYFAAINPTQASVAVQSWLNTPGSLTARLRQQCAHLQVIVLAEGFTTPMPFEITRLNLGFKVEQTIDQAWVRCVLLQCPSVNHSNPNNAHNKPAQNWVYARTVIPNFTPQNPWANLQTLGNQPLGEILFEYPNIQRTPFTFFNPPLDTWPHLSQALNPCLSSQPELQQPTQQPTQQPKQQLTQKAYARSSIFTQINAPQNAYPLHLTEVFLPGLVKD